MGVIRWSAWLIVPLVLGTGPLAAVAMDVSDVAGALAQDRLFVDEGAAEVNDIMLRRAITDAERLGVDLRIAVLSEPGDPDAWAEALLDELGGGTVLVFTADGYGVRSRDLDPRQVERGLDLAGPLLAAGNIESGAATFVAGLDRVDAGRSFTAIGVAVTLAVVLLVASITVLERRRRQRLEAPRIDRHHQVLAARLTTLERELEATLPRVEASHRPDIAAAYAMTAAAHDRARRHFDTAAEGQLDEVAADIASAQASLRTLKQLLG